MLSAEKYLGQLEELDVKIKQEQERLEEMKSSVASVKGMNYSGERVQTSPNNDGFCSDVLRYVELENEIKERILKMMEIREKVIAQIYEIHNGDFIQVLYKKYVQFKTLQQITMEMKRSYSYVGKMHKEALQEFAKLHTDLKWIK